MAKTNASNRVNAIRNPFTGMTMAEMKKKWSSMTPAQRKDNVSNFRIAAKQAPKTKPLPKSSKPSSKVPQRFADGAKGGKYDKAVQNKEKATSNFFRSSSGTRGKSLPSNPKLKSQSKKNLTGRQKINLEVYAASGGKSSHTRNKPKPKVKRNRRGRAV